MEYGRYTQRRWIISARPEDDGTPTARLVPIVWPDLDRLPVLAANQLLVQLDAIGGQPDLVLLTVGHVSPPAVIGPEAAQAAVLERISQVEVQPIGRYSLSVRRLREWSDLLASTLARLESQTPEDGS